MYILLHVQEQLQTANSNKIITLDLKMKYLRMFFKKEYPKYIWIIRLRITISQISRFTRLIFLLTQMKRKKKWDKNSYTLREDLNIRWFDRKNYIIKTQRQF